MLVVKGPSAHYSSDLTTGDYTTEQLEAQKMKKKLETENMYITLDESIDERREMARKWCDQKSVTRVNVRGAFRTSRTSSCMPACVLFYPEMQTGANRRHNPPHISGLRPSPAFHQRRPRCTSPRGVPEYRRFPGC